LEAERQVALWQRKLQLEREIQEVLDPSVGEGVLQVGRWLAGGGGGAADGSVARVRQSVSGGGAPAWGRVCRRWVPIWLWECRPCRRRCTACNLTFPPLAFGMQAMQKEVHRMQLRHAELMRTQERLVQVRVSCAPGAQGWLLVN